jgi:hypothetical protein
MELAALEIARLSEETDYLRQALAAEQAQRAEAEAHVVTARDRLADLEQEVREACAAEFERRLEIEVARWRATLLVEAERGEEHWARKLEVLERTMAADADLDDHDDKENVLVENVHQENDRLRRDNDVLRRELANMSPSKRIPLGERSSDVPASPTPKRGPSLQKKMEGLRVSDSSTGGSPKKMRKLTARKWDSGLDVDDVF